MSNFERIFQISLIAIIMLQLSACSKNIEWEEDVLLNTGETILVYREVRYTIKGEPGNPADLGYLPDLVETISFKYLGRDYVYTGDAGIMVLAISPKKLPVLLALTGRGWGVRNNYPLCAKPNYVQLEPGSMGRWTWPNKIESWTYNLPANLMLNRDHPSSVKRHYTMVDKAKQKYMQDPQLLNSQKINPLAKNQDCHKE